VARAARRQGPSDRRELHEVRPRADDRQDGEAQKIFVNV